MSKKESKPAFGEQAETVSNGNDKADNQKNQELATKHGGNVRKIGILDTTNNPLDPIDFVINGMEEGTVGLLTGAGSTGKGFFALQLCFALADSTKRLNFLNLCNDTRGKVVFLTAEDSETILKHRIKAIGQYLINTVGNDILDGIDENLEVISLQGKMPTIYSTKSDIKTTNAVDQWCNFLLQITEGKRLIVIDTLRQFHNGEENSSGEMSEVIKFFQYVAAKNNCSVLLVHHTSKAGSIGEVNDEQTAARGSSAIVDNVRFQMAIAKISKNQAERYDINEQNRGYYLQMDFPKLNYTKPIAKKWLKRLENGVLEETNLKEKNTKETANDKRRSL